MASCTSKAGYAAPAVWHFGQATGQDASNDWRGWGAAPVRSYYSLLGTADAILQRHPMGRCEVAVQEYTISRKAKESGWQRGIVCTVRRREEVSATAVGGWSRACRRPGFFEQSPQPPDAQVVLLTRAIITSKFLQSLCVLPQTTLVQPGDHTSRPLYLADRAAARGHATTDLHYKRGNHHSPDLGKSAGTAVIRTSKRGSDASEPSFASAARFGDVC